MVGSLPEPRRPTVRSSPPDRWRDPGCRGLAVRNAVRALRLGPWHSVGKAARTLVEYAMLGLDMADDRRCPTAVGDVTFRGHEPP